MGGLCRRGSANRRLQRITLPPGALLTFGSTRRWAGLCGEAAGQTHVGTASCLYDLEPVLHCPCLFPMAAVTDDHMFTGLSQHRFMMGPL